MEGPEAKHSRVPLGCASRGSTNDRTLFGIQFSREKPFTFQIQIYIQIHFHAKPRRHKSRTAVFRCSAAANAAPPLSPMAFSAGEPAERPQPSAMGHIWHATTGRARQGAAAWDAWREKRSSPKPAASGGAQQRQFLFFLGGGVSWRRLGRGCKPAEAGKQNAVVLSGKRHQPQPNACRRSAIPCTKQKNLQTQE